MYGWKREAPVGGPVRLARLKLVEARECGPGRKWQVEFTTPTLPPKTTGMEGRLACNPWFLLRSTYPQTATALQIIRGDPLITFIPF